MKTLPKPIKQEALKEENFSEAFENIKKQSYKEYLLDYVNTILEVKKILELQTMKIKFSYEKGTSVRFQNEKRWEKAENLNSEKLWRIAFGIWESFYGIQKD